MDPAASTPDNAYPLIGQIVGGRYHIVGLIGEGGMGIVYKAEQRLGSTLRKVAVKTLHAELSRDPSITARFHREVGTVAQLEHPNTVRVYDFGSTDDGTLYIAMEYLDGKALNRVIESDGALDPKRVGHLLRQVAGSLDEAHRQGIVHRDLKPENVLLIERAGEKDVVKLVDFGIAARTESAAENAKEQKLTQQGMVLGTPPYMSPEQFTGKPLDARSDVYSLGVMVYEMLTGQLPFQAETAWQWASHHMTSPPRSFEESAAGRNLPEALRRTVLKALSKESADRQASAGQFYTEFVASLGSASFPAPRMQPVIANKTEAMPQATPLAMAATEGMAAVPHMAAAPAPAPAIPAPVGLPPAPPREAASGNNKALIYGLSGLGGVLLIAMGVVALTSGRGSDTPPIDLAPPVTATAPTNSPEPAAPEPPPEPEVKPEPAPEPEKPATTTRPVSTKPAQPASSPSRPTPAPTGTSSGGAPAAPTVPPTTSAPPVPAVTPPVTPPVQQPAPPVTQPKPPVTQPAPPTADACAACAKAAKAGDIAGAARAFAQCSNSNAQNQCKGIATQTAPKAATNAAFSGQCDRARLIIEGANSMGVPSGALAKASKAAQECKPK